MKYEYIQQKLVLLKTKTKKLREDNNMRVEKNNFVQFPDHNHMSATFYKNDLSTDELINQLKNFLPVIAYYSNVTLFIQYRSFSSTVILND